MRAILSDPGVAGVILLALLVNVGTGMVLPVLPLFARSLGVAYGGAGLLVGAYYFARLVFDLAAGTVVDRIGVASSAAVGLLVLAAGALLTGLSGSFVVAVACWGLAGAGAAIVWAAMYNALIRSIPKARMARALSVFYGAFNGGLVAGGFLGGLIAGRIGLAAPLFVLAAIAASLAGPMTRLLPRGKADRPERSARGSIVDLFRIPGFATAVLALLANLWFFGAVFNTLVPLFARDILHLSTAGIGVLYAAALAAEFVVYYPAGTWADRRGRRVVLIPAFVCLALACFAIGWAENTILFAVLLAVLGGASGFAGVPPTAILADVLPANESARGVAVFRFGGDLGFTFGPILAGLTASNFGFKAAFAVAGFPAVLALASLALGRETLATEPTRTS